MSSSNSTGQHSQSEERRTSGVFSALLIDDDERAGRLAQALQGVATPTLLGAYQRQIIEFAESAMLVIGEELSGRGIAPCFRGLDAYDDWIKASPDAEYILAMCDLQWIATRYPNQKPAWERMKGIFDPCKFMKTARFVLWDGRRSPGQVAKGLGLSEGQQRECHRIRGLYVTRWCEGLAKRKNIAAARIGGAVRVHDRRDSTDKTDTIKRRQDLWLCAELGDWKPQRTADLYAMKTGMVLPRNIVANQLGKIQKICRSYSKSSSHMSAPRT